MARLGTGQASLQAIPELAARGGGRAPRLASLADVEREVERVRALGARYLFQGQNAYPSLLAEMESAPPVLIFRGRLELFQRPMIALVGARNASAAACRFARGLAQELEIGRAHVRTPVTNAHLVCRLHLDKHKCI